MRPREEKLHFVAKSFEIAAPFFLFSESIDNDGCEFSCTAVVSDKNDLASPFPFLSKTWKTKTTEE